MPAGRPALLTAAGLLTAASGAPIIASMLAYKVVETSTVTDVALEAIVNEWVRQGWTFDGMQFAMRDSSKRPAMAFLLFTRQEPDAPEAG